MASDRQVLANRINARRSTGPKSLQGKMRSRRNALKHGLTARSVVNAFEDDAEFNDFVKHIGAAYRPTSPVHQELICRLATLLWVRDGIGITGVKPSHGWRHRFKSVARDVEMHPEVEAFLIGHGGSDDDEKVRKVAMKYGDPWVRTLSKNIEKYPRYRIAALNQPATPHKRARRTRAQIAIDNAAKEARKAARATRCSIAPVRQYRRAMVIESLRPTFNSHCPVELHLKWKRCTLAPLHCIREVLMTLRVAIVAIPFFSSRCPLARVASHQKLK